MYEISYKLTRVLLSYPHPQESLIKGQRHEEAMNRLAAVGVAAIAFFLLVSVCGCLQQPSTPANETANVSNVTATTRNVTTNSSLTQGNNLLNATGFGSLNVTDIMNSIGNLTQGNGSLSSSNLGSFNPTDLKNTIRSYDKD